MAGKPGRSGGHNKLPTRIHILNDNPGHRPLNENEPQFAPAPAESPTWLDDFGRELWAEIVPPLLQAGVLSVVDVPMIAAACERWSLYRRSVRKLGRAITRKTPSNGDQARAEIAISKAALQDALAILREFGAGATSRSRIKVPPAAGAEDPFEAYMAKKNKA